MKRANNLFHAPKRILSLQSIPLIFLPIMLLLTGFALWSMLLHRAEMELLVESRNAQEAQFAIALLESKADQLSAGDGAFQAEMLAHELAILKNDQTDQAILIVDQQKNVIYYSGDVHPSRHLVTHPGVDEALNGESGAISEPFPDSIHLISYGPVESLGWAFVIEEFWDGGRFARLNLTLLIPLLLIPLVFIFFLIMWSTNRWVLKPLAILNSYAQEVGNGNYDQKVPLVSGIQEINELYAELESMVQKLGENQNSLHRYATMIQSGQEEERKRLAQELHDDTIQSLIHIDQLVQLLDIQPSESEPLREQIALTSSNLRAMIQDLRPSYLDELGLVPALDMLVKSLGIGREGISIQFQSAGNIQRLSMDEELALYRIAQEGLNNSLKHSNGSNLSAKLEFKPKLIQLSIVDNGTGIQQNVLSNVSKHFGLRGMQERAHSIGSEIYFESESGMTLISVQLEK